MDFMQLLLEQMSGNFNQINLDDVVEKYTNKKYLIELNKASIENQESLPDGLHPFQITKTTELKSSPAVPLHTKHCIAITDLLKSIDKPIIGKFLLCRTICPPVKLTALFTIVDDPAGKLGIRISLYNFVRNRAHTSPKDVYQYLPVGTILAIMNPWFKKTNDGGLTIRCDNPADVVTLNQSMVKEIFGCLTWEGEIPIEYRQKELLAGDSALVTDWKIVGNEFFNQNRFHDSIQAYTNGISGEKVSGKNNIDLLANRSAAYLALQKYKLCLVDAESVLTTDKIHIKCIFRKTKALFGLAQYQNALTFLSNVALNTLPNLHHKKVVTDLIVMAKCFIAQSKDGNYPWTEIYQNKFNELAEFVGPVIVKNTPTKGRGLFATDSIKSGQLILASKAFACIDSSQSNDSFVNMHFDQKTGQKYLSDRTQTQLVTEIAHILKDNPEKCHEVFNLYAGPEFRHQNEPMESHGTDVDMKRLNVICSYNQFGGGSFGNHDGQQTYCGLWLTPSYINHSCVDGNSSWNRRGDYLFVFSFHDIAKNDEILISYAPPLEEKTKNQMESKGFICDCRFCIRNRQDSSTIHTKRTDLILQLDAILKKYGSEIDTVILLDIKDDVHEMTRILQSLKGLRKDAPELNLSYADKLEDLADIYFRNGQFWKSLATLQYVYNLVANIPAFCLMSANISNNIVGVYAVLGQMKKIKEWIPVLKRHSALAYGTWKVIEVTFPFTYKKIKELGISLNDMCLDVLLSTKYQKSLNYNSVRKKLKKFFDFDFSCLVKEDSGFARIILQFDLYR